MNEHDKLLLLTNSTNCNRHVPSLMMILQVGENNELNKTLNESDLEESSSNLEHVDYNAIDLDDSSEDCSDEILLDAAN